MSVPTYVRSAPCSSVLAREMKGDEPLCAYVSPLRVSAARRSETVGWWEYCGRWEGAVAGKPVTGGVENPSRTGEFPVENVRKR